MKGIILNLVEDAICAEHGDHVWDRLLTDAELEGGYTSIGDYPDEHLDALVRAAAARQGVPHDEVLRSLGRAAILGLAEQYPHFFTPHQRTRDFVLTLNDVIHAEVRKIHRNADPPRFVFSTDDVGDLLIEYHSRRGLCFLAEGMLGGAAEHFGEPARIEQDSCTHRGDSRCLLRCRFGAEAETAGT